MAYDPDRHRRNSMRAANFDYTSQARYFVTICTNNRDMRFGSVIESSVRLNDAGEMVTTVWKQLPNRFPNIDLDTFIVMPNHLHGIIVLKRVAAVGNDAAELPTGSPSAGVRADHYGSETNSSVIGTPVRSLGRIVQAFKSLSTREYIHGVRIHGWPQFDGRLWQRSYYDHIIRDDQEHDRIRAYVDANPANWRQDQENPDRQDAAAL